MAYHNLNTLTIFPEKLTHNLGVLSSLCPGIQPVPVVKSNAYGHWIKILAPLLARYAIPFICVDSLYEAYELEKYGYKKDILIMGYVDPRDIPRRKNFIYAASDLDYASAVIRTYTRARIHIFVDTGMHREGIQMLDSIFAKNILTKIRPNIEGLMSHLATPEDIDVSNNQWKTFQEFQGVLASLDIYPRYIHICASGWLIHANKYDFPIGNIARTGLAFFGYGHPDLQPALRCTTRLIQIKMIKSGEAVGYDRTYRADKTTKIWVLPMGYHDGLSRWLSNTGFVSVNGASCPVIGRVSMNLTTIDITHMTDVKIGDEVAVVSEDVESPVSLLRQVERAQIIPYDMLVHMNKEMYRMSK